MTDEQKQKEDAKKWLDLARQARGQPPTQSDEFVDWFNEIINKK